MATQSQPVVSPIPAGYHTLTPYLVARDAVALIDFVKHTFGAEEKFRAIGSAGGIHCEVRIGDSMVMIGGGGPGLSWNGNAWPTALHVYVEDVDLAYRHAIEAGAISVHDVRQRAYGERSAGVKDASGCDWYIATAEGGSYIPKGLRAVSPYLHPQHSQPVIDFLKNAFGAEEVAKFATPDGVIQHAKIKIGDSILEMGDAHGPYAPKPTMFYMYVPDVDALYRRALQAGAQSDSEPKDQPYGDRTGSVKDPFGNLWYIATHFRDMTP